jgi:SNF2 family DNA or RNA helicase
MLLPPREGIHYKQHQIDGIRWMLDRERSDALWCRGGVLADDMGLGKTFQTIGLLLNGDAGLRTLIVCPPALMAGWISELRACGFFVSTLFDGTAYWVPVPADWTGPVVWLTTYPKVCMYHLVLLRSGTGLFDRIVLDEGHVIRNGLDTARGLACFKMSIPASRRWILSATPVQNGIRDWINICLWLRLRCKRALMPEAASDIMLRRTMEELRCAGVAELPAAPVFVVRDLSIPDSVVAKGTDSEFQYFHRLCDQLDDVLDNREVSALVKLELYMRIQQFLVHPQLYIEGRRTAMGTAFPRGFHGHPADAERGVRTSQLAGGARPGRGDWTGGATKWRACVEEDLAEGIRFGEGSIVFCQFRREMDMVAAAAERMGAAVWSVRGGMSVADIGAAVEGGRAAVAEGRPVVMVVQIVAGGVGLNLQFCRRVLFLSQHWNPAVVHQAVGRAVRIGQRETVRVFMYRIVDDVMDNLDLRMSEVHAGKIGVARELCPSFYQGFGGPATAATTTQSGEADAMAGLTEPINSAEALPASWEAKTDTATATAAAADAAAAAVAVPTIADSYCDDPL